MLSGFYTAASGMMMQQRVLNVTSNNIANVHTPGFRTERVVTSTFEDVLLRQEGGQSQIGGGSPIRIVEDVQSEFDPSYLQETNRPYDMAIVGEGYFHVQGTDRELMTRNGNFDIDEEGFLILRGVGRVMGEKKTEIQVKDAYFEVAKDGTVTDSKGKKIDKLKITLPAEGVRMEQYSNGLYFVPDVTTNVPAEGITVNQGQIERSNIDLNREYTSSMESLRLFQSCSSALKIIDQINQKTASQIASL